MGLTERHWFENDEPKLTERQLEDAVYENEKAYERGYQKGYSDRDKKIVRCKDCKHFNTSGCDDGFGWCERNGSGHGSTTLWFCADGERK